MIDDHIKEKIERVKELVRSMAQSSLNQTDLNYDIEFYLQPIAEITLDTREFVERDGSEIELKSIATNLMDSGFEVNVLFTNKQECDK